MYSAQSFAEGDIVTASRPLTLMSVSAAQILVPRGALLLLGPPGQGADGASFEARLLGIRPAQGIVPVEALAPAPSFGEYEPALIEYLPGFASSLSERMGERGLRQLVRIAIQRDKGPGFTEAPGMYLYTEIMMQMGIDFQSDPFLPWAERALSSVTGPLDPGSAAAHRPVHELSFAATDYLQRIMGPEREIMRKALRRAVNLRLDDLPGGGSGFVERMSLFLKRIYPERMSNAAPDAVPRLVRSLPGTTAAESTSRDPAVLIALQFAMGHGALRDPRFPTLRGSPRRAEPMFSILHEHLQAELRSLG